MFSQWKGLGGGAFARFRQRRDDGATAVEYALMAGLVALAIIGTVFFVGDEVRDLFVVPPDAFPEW